MTKVVSCAVCLCRLIDLEAELEPGTESGEGRGDTMLQDEAEAQRREAYSVSRLRSSSIEIREKGTEFLREQLDEAQKVHHSRSHPYHHIMFDSTAAHVFLFYFITSYSVRFIFISLRCFNAEHRNRRKIYGGNLSID